MLRAAAGLLAIASFMPIPAGAAGKCGPAMVQLVVLDQGGSALPGLEPSDFKVRIKGQGATVKAVDFGLFPHITVALVSRTSSMGQSIKLDMARQLAASITNGAPGPVMNGTFAGEVSALADARTQPLGALQAGTDNRNVIYDAINAGMVTMNLRRGDAVVIFTDAPDLASKTTLADLQQRFVNNGARLFVVPLPPATGAGSMQALADLADATGGGVLVPLRVDDSTKGVVINAAQVDGAVTNFSRSYTQYNNIYQLETDLDGQDRPMPLKVEVERRKMGAGKVVAPSMLAPCTAIGQ